MSHIAIIYYSKHHGNTKKLLDSIKNECDVDLIDITNCNNIDLTKYRVIGFASGIYMSKFNEDIIKFIEENGSNLAGKKTFLIYTCGSYRKKYEEMIRKILVGEGMKILGSYYSLGLDTFGPFKIIGGLSKGHPTEEEVSKCVAFYKKVVESEI